MSATYGDIVGVAKVPDTSGDHGAHILQGIGIEGYEEAQARKHERTHRVFTRTRMLLQTCITVHHAPI